LAESRKFTVSLSVSVAVKVEANASNYAAKSGVTMIIVLLFCIPNPEAILTTLTGNPLIELIIQATGSRAAGVVMSCALAICFVNGTIGSVTSGSRLLWAMARDGGAPCSKL
jgi:choline transport protein